MDEYLLTNSTGKASYASYFDTERSILFAKWRGHIDEVPFAKKACWQMVEQAQQLKFKKILNDNRLQIDRWPEVNQWLLETWMPGLGKAGVKYFAHVMSPDEKTNVEAMKVFNKIHFNVEFVTFSSYDSALEWLAMQ